MWWWWRFCARQKNGHGNGYPRPVCNEKERLGTPLTPTEDILAWHVKARGDSFQRVVTSEGKEVVVKVGSAVACGGGHSEPGSGHGYFDVDSWKSSEEVEPFLLGFGEARDRFHVRTRLILDIRS